MNRRDFSRTSAATLAAATLGLPLGTTAFAQTAFKEGKNFLKLKTPVATKAPAGQIEVIEFFSYGCVHCKNFDPVFQAWKKTAPKDVSVRMVHVGFNANFEPLQRIFITLETMGAPDALHASVFRALQDERKALTKPDVLFAWIAAQGLDRAKFESIYNSFSTANLVKRSTQLQEEYQVEGTPAFGIAGRYYTDGSLAGGLQQMVQVADYLLAQVRKG